MIILYDNSGTFTGLGYGALSDAISCKVTEERNGSYELQMVYPLGGVNYSNLALRSIIMAPANPTDQSQPFRIYRITKPLNGKVTVYAAHLSYDLSGYVVKPFSASGIVATLQGLIQNSMTVCPFTLSTSRTLSGAFSISKPQSLRATMMADVLSTFSGEWKFDRYVCTQYLNRGADRGVSIEYGKNLIDLKQEENNDNVVTGVAPFWAKDGETTVYLSGTGYVSTGITGYNRIVPLDCSSDFASAPTESQLTTAAQAYIAANNLTAPKVSITLSFQELAKTEEYSWISAAETVRLCDTVAVKFPALGVSATAKVIKTVYDSLLCRYISVELGDAQRTVADTIIDEKESVYEVAAQASKTAIRRSQRLFYLKANNAAPEAPSAWVTSTLTTANQWTRAIPAPLKNYYYFTCIQYETIGGVVTNDDITLTPTDNTVLAWCSQSDMTYFDGGKIYAHSVTASQLSTDAVKSNNYSAGSGDFSAAGTFLNLSDGSMRSPGLYIDTDGNVKMKGEINASSGLFEGQVDSNSAMIGTAEIDLAVVDEATIAAADVEKATITQIEPGNSTTQTTITGTVSYTAGNTYATVTYSTAIPANVVAISNNCIKVGYSDGQGTRTYYFTPAEDDLSVDIPFPTLDPTKITSVYMLNSGAILFEAAVGASISYTAGDDEATITFASAWPTDVTATYNNYVKVNYQVPGGSTYQFVYFQPNAGDTTVTISIPDDIDPDDVTSVICPSLVAYKTTVGSTTKMNGNFIPYPGSTSSYNGRTLGNPYNYWKEVYTRGTTSTSARILKKDIADMTEAHEALFNALHPRTYKFVNGESNRTHFGLILDELAEAIDAAGLTSQDVAAYTLADITKPDDLGGIRYEELIALCIYEIQKLKAEIESLKLNKEDIT